LSFTKKTGSGACLLSPAILSRNSWFLLSSKNTMQSHLIATFLSRNNWVVTQFLLIRDV
jgi:hypothetical protein